MDPDNIMGVVSQVSGGDKFHLIIIYAGCNHQSNGQGELKDNKALSKIIVSA
jgi:hypothetical protein